MLKWINRLFKRKEIVNPIEILANDDKLKNSDEPWVRLEGEPVINDYGDIQIELDWNDAFIKYLRDKGITGASEEQIVQKWIALLGKSITAQMQEEGDEFK